MIRNISRHAVMSELDMTHRTCVWDDIVGIFMKRKLPGRRGGGRRKFKETSAFSNPYFPILCQCFPRRLKRLEIVSLMLHKLSQDNLLKIHNARIYIYNSCQVDGSSVMGGTKSQGGSDGNSLYRSCSMSCGSQLPWEMVYHRRTAGAGSHGDQCTADKHSGLLSTGTNRPRVQVQLEPVSPGTGVPQTGLLLEFRTFQRSHCMWAENVGIFVGLQFLHCARRCAACSSWQSSGVFQKNYQRDFMPMAGAMAKLGPVDVAQHGLWTIVLPTSIHTQSCTQ